MSLLKKNGKSKKPEQETTTSQSTFLEAPPSPSSRLFRKSTSIEAGSDVERPNSRQSGKSVGGAGGGGKKKISGFLSKVFKSGGAGGNNKIPTETVEESVICPKPLSSFASGAPPDSNVGGVVQGNGRSTSHESVNSDMSTESFSYVNAKNFGGKRAKGKRIPVDDPNYGCTTNASVEGGAAGTSTDANGGNAVIKNGDKKTSGGGISGTLDRIGAKIGLKKKYNLQSCESLQYIDACEEPYLPAPPPPPPIATPSSSVEVSPPKSVEVAPPKPDLIMKSKGAELSFAIKWPLSSSSSSSNQAPPPTDKPSTSTPPSQLKLSPKLSGHQPKKNKYLKSAAVFTSPVEDKLLSCSIVTETEPLPPPPSTPPQQPKAQVRRRSSTKEIKKTFSESSAQTQEAVMVPPPPSVIVASASPAVPPPQSVVVTSIATPPSILVATTSSTIPPPPSVVVASSSSIVPPKEDTPANPKEKPSIKPPSSTVTETLTTTVEEEPRPSTSASAFPSISNSNTWSNSGRRKRKAPLPPLVASSKNKFANGVSSSAQTSTSVVGDTQNDVPTSSSQAAMLKKFTKIEEERSMSGPSTRPSCGTFEIRPRKKESSVEPMMIHISSMRPTSSFDSASITPGSSQTLFTRSINRYHKRSSSEGQSAGSTSNSNTNTRGRVHKQGKKKAPPPPNPFGDPDAEEEMEETSEAANVQLVSSNVSAQLDPPNPFEEIEEEPQETVTPSSSSTANNNPLPSPPPITAVSPLDTIHPPPPPSSPPPPEIMEDCPLRTDQDAIEEEILQNRQNEQQELILQQNGEATPDFNDLLQSSDQRQETSTTPVMENENNANLNLSAEGQDDLSAVTPSSEEIRPILTPTISSPSTSVGASVIVTSPRNSTVITETDIQSAQHSLDVLATSIATPTPSSSTRTSTAGPVAGPSSSSSDQSKAKAKLLELKKEADKSPFNSCKSPSSEGGGAKKSSGSRPISIGSSIIYESPLSILFGKATGSSNHTDTASSGDESTGHRSPKITHKTPWYKHFTPSVFSSRHSNTHVVKPFTSLVKFSELDKEAGRIVEENRRRSEERRMQETERELMEMFAELEAAAGIEGPSEPAGQTDQPASSSSTSRAVEAVSTPTTSSPPTPSTPPTRILTSAQVHSQEPEQNPEEDQTQSDSLRTQDSSSPTFQSVHAASKHREKIVIKPLLTSSPITNMKSEKLAIVQPQQAQATNSNSSVSASSSPSTSGAVVVPSSTSPSRTESGTSRTTIASSTTSPVAPSSSAATPTTSSPPTSPSSLGGTTTVTSSISSRPTAPEWDCPRCTLKNPNWRILCEICFQRKDPPPTSTSSSSNYMSSILQRVNAESSHIKSTGGTIQSPSPLTTSTPITVASNPTTVLTATTPSISSKSTATTTTTSSSATTCIPSVVYDYLQSPTSSPPTSSSSNPSHAQIQSTHNKDKSKDKHNSTSDIPPCENFLSQLPAKDDLPAKKSGFGKLLQTKVEDTPNGGVKLQDNDNQYENDPELEELDISKLRKARLAYFQNHHHLQETTPPSPPTTPSHDDDDHQESDSEKPNNLDRRSSFQTSSGTNELLKTKTTPNPPMPLNDVASPPHSLHKTNTFSDDEDDFIDYLLQLNAVEISTSSTNKNIYTDEDTPPTATSNITHSPKPTQQNSDSNEQDPNDTFTTTSTQQGTVTTSANNTNSLSNRYKPKLEAIREGNSQDYMYCYSSSEIAKIYENWQTNRQPQNANLQNNMSMNTPRHHHQPSLLRVGSPNLLDPTTSTAPSLVHHHYPLSPPSFNINFLHNTPFLLTANSPIPPYQLPALLQDHQPYANNRLSQSPEENYVNTTATPTTAITASTTSPPPPMHIPFENSASLNRPCSNINGNNIGGINSNIVEESRGQFVNNFNYENNINGGNMSGGGRRLTYEDYRRMGAIPKGFQGGNGGISSRDEWSSESSSSDGGLQFNVGSGRGTGSGFTDLSPGLTRRGTLDFAPTAPSFPGFPDQTMAVSKLMKRLEAAIAQGDHRLAATLAHDMALMKVNCVVAKINQPFSIRVYVEDRFMQQGPFLVQVSSMMTVRDLRTKIERDWGIPSGFQRWILGQKMAEDDNQSLTSFEITQDSMAFLFLVTPEMGNISLNLPSSSSSQKSAGASISMENKISNHKSSTLSDLSSSSSSASSSTGLSRNIIDGNMISPGSSSSQNNAYINNNLVTKAAAGSAKKVSSVAQTSTSLQIPSSGSSKSKNLKTKEPSPPPLPPKSPIPPSNVKTPVTTSSQKSVTSSPSSSRSTSSPQKSLKSNQTNAAITMRKENGSNSQLTADTISAASALTQSLQQKLSEFKAVAEQTFGKSNPISNLPPKAKKEQSPAPPPKPTSSARRASAGNHEPSPKRTIEAKVINSEAINKAPARRSAVKSQLSQEKGSNSSSREKLSSINGSKEKLTEAITLPENRFNGILLQTPKPDEPIRPPERVRKSEERILREEASNSKSGSESKGKVTPIKVLENDASNDNSITVPVTDTTPSEENAKISEEKAPITSQSGQSSLPVGSPTLNYLTSDDEASTSSSAPTPKPRGIKKQQSTTEKVEKVSQGTESPTVIVPAKAMSPVPSTSTSQHDPPKPFPRTMAPSSHAGSPAPSTKPADPPTSGEIPTPIEKQAEADEVKVDDFCQTTLPFPPAKYKASSSGTGGLLLRPSAFVTQFKQQSAEIRSGSGSPRSSLIFNPPTAFVSPSVQHTPPFPSPSSSTPPENEDKPKNVSKEDGPPPPEPAPASTQDSNTSYLKMLELMEKQDLISNGEDAECPVCFGPIARGEGILLRDCLHVFCRDCLVGCVQYADDSTVKCPYRDNDYACNNNLQEREIKALVPPEVFEKYLARSVKLAESKIVNTFHCKTPDCTGWCVFEDDVNIFVCPVCKKRNCLTCAAIHEGIDCHKYQREMAIAAETDEDAKQSRLMLEKMIQRGEALDCPACHVVLLKKWGCDWVRCSYCKTEICWVTKGFRWGPGGKGDLSGGCKCGINGVKCHPKCTYCH